MNRLTCARLKYFREKANITPLGLASMVDLSPADILDFENGRAEPSMRQFAAIAEALNISTDELTVFED